MNKYQSIISAIISAICIFVLPYVNRHGFVIDEATASSIIIGIVGLFVRTTILQKPPMKHSLL